MNPFQTICFLGMLVLGFKSVPQKFQNSKRTICIEPPHVISHQIRIRRRRHSFLRLRNPDPLRHHFYLRSIDYGKELDEWELVYSAPGESNNFHFKHFDPLVPEHKTFHLSSEYYGNKFDTLKFVPRSYANVLRIKQKDSNKDSTGLISEYLLPQRQGQA